jgi:hypothetical protein
VWVVGLSPSSSCLGLQPRDSGTRGPIRGESQGTCVKDAVVERYGVPEPAGRRVATPSGGRAWSARRTASAPWVIAPPGVNPRQEVGALGGPPCPRLELSGHAGERGEFPDTPQVAADGVPVVGPGHRGLVRQASGGAAVAGAAVPAGQREAQAAGRTGPAPLVAYRLGTSLKRPCRDAARGSDSDKSSDKNGTRARNPLRTRV